MLEFLFAILPAKKMDSIELYLYLVLSTLIAFVKEFRSMPFTLSVCFPLSEARDCTGGQHTQQQGQEEEEEPCVCHGDGGCSSPSDTPAFTCWTGDEWTKCHHFYRPPSACLISLSL